MLSLLMHMPLLAGEIAQALLYARPPEWADKAAVSIEQRASSQRFSAMTAVCEAAPQEVGPSAMGVCAHWQQGEFAYAWTARQAQLHRQSASHMPQHAGVHSQTAGLLA